jgi:hypothetical protein
LIAFGFHLIGETVFWLKSLYQLGFVRFFGFYFWIGVVSKDEYYYQTVFIKNNRSTLPRIG